MVWFYGQTRPFVCCFFWVVRLVLWIELQKLTRTSVYYSNDSGQPYQMTRRNVPNFFRLFASVYNPYNNIIMMCVKS